MINVLILINLIAGLLVGSVGCNEKDQGGPPVDLSGQADENDPEAVPDEADGDPAIVRRTKQIYLPRGDLSVYPPSVDSDQDNIPNQAIPGNDRIDNCPDVFNPTQDDSDGDGHGDACDND